MANPVVHFEIASKDGRRAMEFYSKLFDWKIDVDPKMNYGMVDTKKEGSLGGGIFQCQEQMPPYVTIYVQVDDLQASLDKAEKLGAKVIQKPTVISPEIGSCAMFADPDGNVIGLFK